MLVGIGLTDLTFRTSQVALPLVVLLGTGSAAATGLVGGAAGIPVLLSPWWSRRLRHRISSGRAVAVCYLGEALALAAVAWAATTGHLEVALLAAAGLVLGTAEALDGPGRDALLADLGDQCGADRALTLLTARDFFRRVSMVVGPALGGLLVARGRAVELLWVEVASVLVSAALVAGIRAVGAPQPREEADGIWRTVRVRPDVLAGWVVRGTGCALWFGFTLGLALLGAEHGRGGLFLAAGVTAYGVGSVLGTLGVLPLLRILPVLPTIAGAWALTGACWFVMGRMPSMQVIAVAGFVSGLAVVVGNAGVTAQITRGAEGPARRTLMAGQSVVVNASASLGLLAGGPVLAGLGAPLTLTTTGLLTVAVSGGVLVVRGVSSQPKRPATSAARAPYPPPNRQACTSSGKS
jgi:predicted MFS family arabinose efflux permease